MFALLVLVSLVISGSLSAPVLSRDGEGSAELVLLFDPRLLKHHHGLTDDYDTRPLRPPLLPHTENPYQPNLEDEYD